MGFYLYPITVLNILNFFKPYIFVYSIKKIVKTYRAIGYSKFRFINKVISIVINGQYKNILSSFNHSVYVTKL